MHLAGGVTSAAATEVKHAALGRPDIGRTFLATDGRPETAQSRFKGQAKPFKNVEKQQGRKKNAPCIQADQAKQHENNKKRSPAIKDDESRRTHIVPPVPLSWLDGCHDLLPPK